MNWNSTFFVDTFDDSGLQTVSTSNEFDNLNHARDFFDMTKDEFSQRQVDGAVLLLSSDGSEMDSFYSDN